MNPRDKLIAHIMGVLCKYDPLDVMNLGGTIPTTHYHDDAIEIANELIRWNCTSLTVLTVHISILFISKWGFLRTTKLYNYNNIATDIWPMWVSYGSSRD